MGLIRIAIATHSAPIRRQGAHSDRNCVPFSTHRGVRKPVFDVPKIMTPKKTHVFTGFAVPKIGTAKIRVSGQLCLRSAEISAKSRQQTQQRVPQRPPCPNCSWGLAHNSRTHIHMFLAGSRLMRHFIRAGVCVNLSAFPTAQVPARLLASRARGKPGISLGPPFVSIPPRFQRPRCRPGFWATEPVRNMASLSGRRISITFRSSSGTGVGQVSGPPDVRCIQFRPKGVTALQ